MLKYPTYHTIDWKRTSIDESALAFYEESDIFHSVVGKKTPRDPRQIRGLMADIQVSTMTKRLAGFFPNAKAAADALKRLETLCERMEAGVDTPRPRTVWRGQNCAHAERVIQDALTRKRRALHRRRTRRPAPPAPRARRVHTQTSQATAHGADSGGDPDPEPPRSHTNPAGGAL